MRLRTILVKALAVVVTSASLAVAAPIELVTNGNFETGSFTGWTVTNQAGGLGKLVHRHPRLQHTAERLARQPRIPAGGSFYAVTDQGGGGAHSLTQAIVVPVSSQVIISFDFFVNDWSVCRRGRWAASWTSPSPGRSSRLVTS